MSFVRILGIILIVAGGAMFMFSNYIQTQVNAGQAQVESGQQKVDTMNSLFSVNPYSKGVGQTLFTNPGQERINQGQLEIAHYSALIKPLQYAGIACFILGILLIIFGGKKRLF